MFCWTPQNPRKIKHLRIQQQKYTDIDWKTGWLVLKYLITCTYSNQLDRSWQSNGYNKPNNGRRSISIVIKQFFQLSHSGDTENNNSKKKPYLYVIIHAWVYIVIIEMNITRMLPSTNCVFISWLSDWALFPCVERRGLTFKFGFKFPADNPL